MTEPDLGSSPAVTVDLGSNCLACGGQPAGPDSLVCPECAGKANRRGITFSSQSAQMNGPTEKGWIAGLTSRAQAYLGSLLKRR